MHACICEFTDCTSCQHVCVQLEDRPMDACTTELNPPLGGAVSQHLPLADTHFLILLFRTDTAGRLYHSNVGATPSPTLGNSLPHLCHDLQLGGFEA